MVASIPFKLHIGPRGGAAWWRGIQASIEEFLASTEITDPLFLSLLPRITEGREELDRLQDEDVSLDTTLPNGHRPRGGHAAPGPPSILTTVTSNR